MKNKIIVTFIMVLLFNGCANTTKQYPNSKIEKNINDYQSFLIIPTGDIVVSTNATNYTASTLTGAVAAVILNTSESTKQEKYTKQREVAYSIFRSGAIQNQIQDLLKKRIEESRSNIAAITFDKYSNKAATFNEWYETTSRLDLDKGTVNKYDLIIDYGIENLKLYSNLIGNTYVEGSVGFRLIDPQSGRVLARAKVQSINFLDVVKIKVELDGIEENSNQYIESVKKAYCDLFSVLTARAIEQLGL
jgi:hypothetical protein